MNISTSIKITLLLLAIKTACQQQAVTQAIAQVKLTKSIKKTRLSPSFSDKENLANTKP